MFYNTGYEVFFSGIFAAFSAQALKVFFYFIVHRKINFKIFTTTGGMPSSHTAGVIALTISAGIVSGFSSVIFAVSAGYAVVIMQDAAGLRRAAGKTAATLNKLVAEMIEHKGGATPYVTLKELLGHTPLEVFCGAIYGIFIAYFIHYLPIVFKF